MHIVLLFKKIHEVVEHRVHALDGRTVSRHAASHPSMNVHLERFIPRDDSALWQNVFAEKIDDRLRWITSIHVKVLDMLWLAVWPVENVQ
jgi:hypothetical protein